MHKCKERTEEIGFVSFEAMVKGYHAYRSLSFSQETPRQRKVDNSFSKYLLTCEDQRGATHKGVVNCRILLTRFKILMYSKNPSFAASASSPRLRSFAIVYTRYKVQSVRRSPVYDYFSKLTADMHSVLPGSYSTSFCLTCIAFTNPHAPIALFSGHSCE